MEISFLFGFFIYGYGDFRGAEKGRVMEGEVRRGEVFTAFSDMRFANGKVTGGIVVMWRVGIGWNWLLT